LVFQPVLADAKLYLSLYISTIIHLEDLEEGAAEDEGQDREDTKDNGQASQDRKGIWGDNENMR
jgi:hypothetical protein